MSAKVKSIKYCTEHILLNLCRNKKTVANGKIIFSKYALQPFMKCNVPLHDRWMPYCHLNVPNVKLDAE